jgi:Mre11 DNA-binding presumed domain
MDHKLYMTFVHKVNALIDKANELWDERNAKAVAEGEEELELMLPLIRLKVPSFLSSSNLPFIHYALSRSTPRVSARCPTQSASDKNFREE